MSFSSSISTKINGVAERSEAQPLIADREVLAKPVRRNLSGAYKLRVLVNVARHREAGTLGAYLRSEGLYSSQISAWEKLYAEQGEVAFKRSRGRKKSESAPLTKKVKSLEARNRKLEKALAQAHAIIEIQKKVAAILTLGNESEGSD